MILVKSTMERRDRAKKTMIRFWTGSVLVHLLLAVVLWTRAPRAPNVEPVTVDFISEEELRPAAPEAKARRRDQSTPVTHQQIVEQEHQLNDEIDPNTRFLSAFNQKVLQATRAERSGKFNNSVHGGEQTSLGRAGAKSTPAPERKSAGVDHAPGDLSSLGDLLPKYDAPSIEAADRAQNENPGGDPTRTDDYLKDVKSGLQTMMSTREFVYYAYYNRIKAALRSHWEPDIRERVNIIQRQGRQLAAAHDRVTQVVVTLDARGELLGVQILSQSGLADLDNAAVEAFRNAAPFPNPPRGMVEVDGTVKIRWDFVLEV